MKPSKSLLESRRIVSIVAMSVAAVSVGRPASARAETNVAVPAFESVELRSCGKVTLRHGNKRRVTLIKGNTTVSTIRVEEGKRLLIDACPDQCPKGYKLEVEIEAPEIDALSVQSGGWLRCVGSFPRQADLAAAVSNGGTLDVRSMNVDAVAAAVQQGGRILTDPHETLTAAIAQGGVIRYWGNPDVTQSVDHGGVVARGKASDRNRPLDELRPDVAD